MYDDLANNFKSENKLIDTNSPSQNILFDESENYRHEVCILQMSDVELAFKQKTKAKMFLRNVNLTAEENFELIRPFMGNPFQQPGSLSARSPQVALIKQKLAKE